ncbi:TM0106 family RecB-like putative nuclease [Granulicoccus phenolivorans]|uniref:TM0106 family RecB-like putative nuclease n=1 Tax=Granulicoccus phenolivorans TaxID=266854 RepID=UPI00041B45B7|nr:TM0106 family RecB-like putative nuclease [Granulicoccus phenolivorans]
MELALDAWAARTCAMKTWNNYSPLVEMPQPDEALQEYFVGASEYVAGVQDTVLAAADLRTADLRPLQDRPPAEQAAACVASMATGVEVIVAGLLPRDLRGHRSGRAHLWLRGADRADGRPGYHPVLAKRHRIQERRQSSRTGGAIHSLLVSDLARPLPRDCFEVPDRAVRTGSREGDLIQLAHYWRLLEAAGFAAEGTPRGGIIGTDQPLGDERTVLTWIDLDEPIIRTFSRSAEEGWAMRTILQRYDHEHGFRVFLAEQALAGQPQPIRPIRNRECDSCPWWEICRTQLPTDDLSIKIDKAPLDVREISVLRSLGVHTITDLAGTDLERLLEVYLPEVAHRPRAEERLRLAAHRAGLLLHGVELERTGTAPIALPEAEIEIDFDIETSAEDRVYLWGFWVRRRQPDGGFEAGEYVAFVAWDDLADDSELALARAAMNWLRDLVDGAASVAVYHYSSYEKVRLGQLAAGQDPALVWATGYARSGFVDLFSVMQEHFFGTHGLGLKVVAKEAAGFEWRDDDPGGLNSQTWFNEAVHGETEEVRSTARARVLAYNEDDVRATLVLRDWLRTQN